MWVRMATGEGDSSAMEAPKLTMGESPLQAEGNWGGDFEGQGVLPDVVGWNTADEPCDYTAQYQSPVKRVASTKPVTFFDITEAP